MSPSMLRDLPEEERPRERLDRLGPEALAHHELLAILLRSGRRGESAVALAQAVLKEAGGLGRLSTLSPAQLVRLRLGRVQAVTLKAAIELAARMGNEALSREKFSSPERVGEYLSRLYGRRTQESTGVLLLDAKHRLVKDRECYLGTIDRAVVEPREILKQALLEEAAAMILYHNHPSGDAAPSPEDVDFTRRLRQAADLVGVRLLDHVVVGRGGWVSLRERGLL
ncbi:MAG TPA: DNA repair protein RadC [Thermoanaerobaculia bacterium]|nr:DNA repair protein RadC [Thermoanaerobaculia bacterium]